MGALTSAYRSRARRFDAFTAVVCRPVPMGAERRFGVDISPPPPGRRAERPGVAVDAAAAGENRVVRSGRVQLPLLVGPAVGGPLHDLRPVARRRTGDVRHQSAVVADDGEVPVAGGPQVPLLVGAAGGGPLLELETGGRGEAGGVGHLAGGAGGP